MYSKSTITACVHIQDGGGKACKIVRRFGAMTGEWRGLASWLIEEGVTHVAIESAAVYWKPVWNILEGRRMERDFRGRRPVAIKRRKHK
jgi:hypothetical protein